jgi:hypothetical protein
MAGKDVPLFDLDRANQIVSTLVAVGERGDDAARQCLNANLRFTTGEERERIREIVEARLGALDPTDLAVLGYGSIGAEELGFASDLDLVFVHGADPNAVSDGARPLARERDVHAEPSPDKPRRWFRLEDGDELRGHDSDQAIFLARHYMALPDTKVRSVEWIDRFSDDYPAVNRLLPVWKVRFDRADNLEVLIYTETGAVAAVSNDWKSSLQRAFQWVHTWSFLPREAEAARILLITALVGSLLALALTGTAMLILIRRKVNAPGTRGWHRIRAYARYSNGNDYRAAGLDALIDDDPPDLSHAAHTAVFVWSVLGGYELQNLEVALALAHVPDLEGLIERLAGHLVGAI